MYFICLIISIIITVPTINALFRLFASIIDAETIFYTVKFKLGAYVCGFLFIFYTLCGIFI